jgi:hypothetical protein
MNEYPQLPTWKFLISMLSSTKPNDMESSVKCLQILTYSNKKYWRSVLEYGAVEKMCNILKQYASDLLNLNDKVTKINGQINSLPAETDKEVYLALREDIKAAHEEILPQKKVDIAVNTLSVLCNLCDQMEVKVCLSEVKDLCEFVMKILRFAQNEDVESRIAILISDIVNANEAFKSQLADRGCLDLLMKLLDRDTEDLLVNVVNAIETLCKGNLYNQDYCCDKGILALLINLLYLNSGEILKRIN